MIAKVIVLLAVVGAIAAQNKPGVGTFDLPNGKPSPVRPGNVAVPIPQPVPGDRKTRAAPPQSNSHPVAGTLEGKPGLVRPAVQPAANPAKNSGPRKTRSSEAEFAQRTKDIPKRQPY